ncbi:hypothetical protein ACIQTZ_01450 [Paenarthrobacter sp. NPDC090520]|uniref:hypothetical protein n=1 Tax=Paenarthrobacter sp. NPDC090520 TaxID=3364382 RepID=UPI003830130F
MTSHFSTRAAGTSGTRKLSAWAMALVLRATPMDDETERGDVPGWVMITLMSAILVAGLLAIASPALENLFNQAMSKVGN